MAEMRWLCLHFPDLALELHGLERPRPQALLDKRQRVAQVNDAARQQGVMPGQALATALALSPQLALLRSDAGRQQAELERLALWAGAFSARISLLPPQALLLEVASMLRYFGGLPVLLERVRAALQETGYAARLALGESALGAELLAAITDWEGADSESWQTRLAQLTIDQLQLSAALVEQLQGVGLRTLGDLQRLQVRARSELARRFGPALPELLARIAGTRVRLPPIFEPPERFCQWLELAAEVEHSQGLLFPLRRLLAALEGFLRLRQQQAGRIVLLLKQRTAEQRVVVAHAGGAAAAAQWLELCRLQFALGLQAEALQQQRSHNQDLFAARKGRLDPEALLSRLQSRLGPGAVLGLALQADHRPEWVVHTAAIETALEVTADGSAAGRGARRIAGSGERTRVSADQGAGGAGILVGSVPYLRPGWLVQRPQRLSQALLQQLQLLSGPERIVSGWWEQAPRESAAPPLRDYFVARWPDGRCGWLFRDRRGRWFLHGWFG